MTRKVQLLAIVALASMLPGCVFGFPEFECGRPDQDTLGLSYGIENQSIDKVAFWFGCEAVEREFSIDRYTFLIRTPVIEESLIEPDAAELSTVYDGSAVYFVATGRVVMTDPPAAPYYAMNFTRWDPQLNGMQEPQLTITWISESSAPANDELPRGTYEIKVGLRSGADEHGWLNATV